MRGELTVTGTATAIEGPLVFLRRNVTATLNEAVEVLIDDQPPRPEQLQAFPIPSGQNQGRQQRQPLWRSEDHAPILAPCPRPAISNPPG